MIDCDVHCRTPTFAELGPYLEEYYREGLRLRGYKQSPAVDNAYPAGVPLFAGAGDVTLEELQAGALDAASRAVLHCYVGLENFTHPYLCPALATAVNRWVKDEWLDRDERLLGSAVVWVEDPAAAVAEIERVAGEGRFVQILVPARSWQPYGANRYWPIWEAAADHGLAVCITYGGITGAPPTPVNWMNGFFEDYVTWTLPFASQVNSLIFSGIFDRRPGLTFVLSESGWTWLSPLLWRMDAQWRSFQREVPWLRASPSEYARRHFRLTTQPFDAPPDPKHVRDLVDELGSDGMLMFGSDFPHRYPTGIDVLLEQLTPAETERLLSTNAIDCYSLT